jgi:hypothetical protein
MPEIEVNPELAARSLEEGQADLSKAAFQLEAR